MESWRSEDGASTAFVANCKYAVIPNAVPTYIWRVQRVILWLVIRYYIGEKWGVHHSVGKDRYGGLRADILKSVRTTEEGGSGVAERFWEWCDKETMVFR